MTTIQFSIYGNQENDAGNPIPYFRQTQASSRFNASAKRYHAWKDHVRGALQVCHDVPITVPDRNQVLSLFDGTPDASMEIMIHFASESHADPDNIFKGIADALFDNDKHLACDGIHFEHAADKKGRVDVTIKFL